MADTIRTQAELLTIFADGQNANAITEQDLRDLIVSLPSIIGGFWEFNLDNQYTLASKKSIAAGARTKVTINGLLDYQTSDVTKKIWNTTTGKVAPLFAGDFLTGRFAMAGWSDVASVNRFEIEFDVGGSAGVIGQDTAVFAKGAANAQNFNFILPAFVGADFFANGGEIYITPESNASFWEHALTIERSFKQPV